MRIVVNAIIKDKEGKILVVDKPKDNGKLLTILPGGKVNNQESFEEALERELEEELGIIRGEIGKKIGELIGISPTAGIETKVILYEFIPNDNDFETTREVNNPRFLTLEEILSMENVTDLTKNAIKKII